MSKETINIYKKNTAYILINFQQMLFKILFFLGYINTWK